MSASLFVACRPRGQDNPRWRPVGLLERTADGYRFRYTRGAQSLEDFRPFHEMPNLDAVYESETLFALFANRLLTARRPEFEDYLAWSGFDPANAPDPLVLLGVTEGRRETDALEVFARPAPDEQGDFSVKFFVHGLRWLETSAVETVDELEPGEELSLAVENDNPVDPFAVGIVFRQVTGSHRVGFVPRYLARDVRTLLNQCDPGSVSLRVDRLNRDAPMQQRLLCRFKSCWPESFQPCSGPEFEPIANLAPAAQT